MPQNNRFISTRKYRYQADEIETKDKIRGCFFGGAVGDAIGYSLRDEFSDDFLVELEKAEPPSNTPLSVSSLTQTALFTAAGLLDGRAAKLNGKSLQSPHNAVWIALHDWLITQTQSFEKGKSYHRGFCGESVSRLRDTPELYARRDPDLSALHALSTRQDCEPIADFISENTECSAFDGACLARVAPLALDRKTARMCGKIENLDFEAAQTAAVTHPNPLAYISAAVLCHILRKIIFSSRFRSVSYVVNDALKTVRILFASEPETDTVYRRIDRAVELSCNGKSDEENMRVIDHGQTAPEVLAVALYCSARNTKDFTAGISNAVRFGDYHAASGAVAGNILGAINGFSNIRPYFKKNTEFSDLLLETSDNLHKRCPNDPVPNNVWPNKHPDMHRKHTVGSDCSHIILSAMCGDISDTQKYDAVLYSDRLSDDIHPDKLRAGQTVVIHENASSERILIKTVCPTWQGGKNGEIDFLAASYRSALISAAENGARNIAIFPISVGTSDYPVEIAAKTAVRTVMKYIKNNPGVFDRIHWIVKDRRELSVCRAQIERYDMDRLTQALDS